jgi:hypothetical protein
VSAVEEFPKGIEEDSNATGTHGGVPVAVEGSHWKEKGMSNAPLALVCSEGLASGSWMTTAGCLPIRLSLRPSPSLLLPYSLLSPPFAY